MAFSFPTGEFGERAARRLREERLAWLVTVRRNGAPRALPVWFLWQDGTILLYSRPGTGKLRDLEANPRLALHLDGNGEGGDIVVVEGEARVGGDEPPADAVPEYVEKYGRGFERLGMSPKRFAADYSVPIRVSVARLRGH